MALEIQISYTNIISEEDAKSTKKTPKKVAESEPEKVENKESEEKSPSFDAKPEQSANAYTPAEPAAPQQKEFDASQVAKPSQSFENKEDGKMFIGGLNWDTTEDSLYEYFSKYGTVTEHLIMKDPTTGRSRGFAFLTFADATSVDEVIKKDHILDGKLIDPKRAIAKEQQDKVGKIFVGGIDPFVTEKDFHEFFSKFGKIIDAQLMVDKDSGRSRGFGFITYENPESVDKVTVNKYLELKGKAMEVKRAEPRGAHQSSKQYNPYNIYGQAPQNGTPEAMQQYWQKMQWYMMQQQQQAAMQTEENTGAKPLNPQQMNAENEGEKGESGRNGRRGGRQRNRDRRRGGSDKDRRSPPSGPSGSNSVQIGDGRKLNLPTGPKGDRQPPSGPSGSRSGYKKGGFHPYRGDGGRRRRR